MNGLMYTSSFTATTQTGSRDLFDVIVATPDIFILHSVRIGQRGLEGDALAEMLEIKIQRAAAVGAGTANTPRPHMLGSPVASSTVVTNAALAAAPTAIITDVFNLQAGWLYLPTPEERIVVTGTATDDVLVVTIEAPAATTEWSGSMTFEEILG